MAFRKSNYQSRKTMDKNLYIQYGCGGYAPVEWINYDVSPTLRLQKIPFIGPFLAKKAQGFNFPPQVRFGDIVKGLPVAANSCAGVSCSHVLEHMTRERAQIALKNTYDLLQPGGVFRCVLPNLTVYIQRYTEQWQAGNPLAADVFMREACLGVEDSHDGWRGPMRRLFGNYMHLWMWDTLSFEAALRKAGFTNIRPCCFGDAADPMFAFVEREHRFRDALAYECVK
jgi:SAM-dependent methyltransferase